MVDRGSGIMSKIREYLVAYIAARRALGSSFY